VVRLQTATRVRRRGPVDSTLLGMDPANPQGHVAADEGPGRARHTGVAVGRPLIVTSDDNLLDALLRLTAAAGVTPDVAPDHVAARRLWSAASLVLVSDELVAAVAGVGPPHRLGVLVVTSTPDELSVWQRSLALGAERVLVLPDDEPTLIDRLADTVDEQRRSTFTAAVVGGCGGAGASTFAAGLGMTAGGLGARALLLDGDPLGGGLDLVLGSEAVPGVRWPDLMGTSGRVSAPSLREALPQVGSLAVLSWDRGDLTAIPPPVMREVLAAGRRGHDVVVVDLPRRLDAAGEEALLKADKTFLVVPGEVRAVAAAGRVAAQLAAVTSRVELIVRGPGPAGLDGPLVSDTLEIPLAAEMRAERGLGTALDMGEGLWRRRRGALARACRAVLEHELAVRSGAA
jgi:secretion/DNA translocation related CpaE-like protein